MEPDEHDSAARQLLVAHRRYLDAAVNLLRQMPPKLGREFNHPSPLVLLALAVRLVQRGCAARTLCVAGYAGDTGPLLRSMLSALASIAYIARDDTDSRALAFLVDEVRISLAHLGQLSDDPDVLPDERAEVGARRFVDRGRRIGWIQSAARAAG